MPQLIEGGLMGVDPAEAGPRYPLTCPDCGEPSLSMGKAEALAYDQEHHGEHLTEVAVPLACGHCDHAFDLTLKPDILGELVLVVRRLSSPRRG